jgi:hypothetical protein
LLQGSSNTSRMICRGRKIFSLTFYSQFVSTVVAKVDGIFSRRRHHSEKSKSVRKCMQSVHGWTHGRDRLEMRRARARDSGRRHGDHRGLPSSSSCAAPVVTVCCPRRHRMLPPSSPSLRAAAAVIVIECCHRRRTPPPLSSSHAAAIIVVVTYCRCHPAAAMAHVGLAATKIDVRAFKVVVIE